ncbi:small integral membrane protein 33 [Prinia subflava]|uniref:small integral membrane protein 33 n=1 Tax=Prinia subflava TaxID=208062 RepID=UPI002FE3111E
MNASVPGSQLRQPEPQDVAAFTPVSILKSVTKRSDALPMISVIVAAFVLLAVLIILAVHYGPQLRTVHITLYHEPMPQHMDSVLLTDWRQLGSLGMLPGRDLPGMGSAGVTCHCSCSRHLPHGSAEPNVIEITYL